MLRVRGAVLESTLLLIRARLSASDEAAFRERLDPALHPLLESPVDPDGWGPAADLAALMDAFAAVLPGDPARTWWDMGRQSCDDSLTSVYRLMSRLASPEFVLRRAVRIWRDYYDRGEFEVIESSAETGGVRVSRAGFPHPALCWRIGGWIERAIELSGGREVVVTHPVCGFARGEAEEWRARWKR